MDDCDDSGMAPADATLPARMTPDPPIAADDDPGRADD